MKLTYLLMLRFEPWLWVYELSGVLHYTQMWQWIAKLRSFIVHKNAGREKFIAACHDIPISKPMESLIEKAINWAMMLVTLHLINAWILKPLLKCHIYLISRYSRDRVQAFKGFNVFKSEGISPSWKYTSKCHLNGNLYIKNQSLHAILSIPFPIWKEVNVCFCLEVLLQENYVSSYIMEKILFANRLSHIIGNIKNLQPCS